MQSSKNKYGGGKSKIEGKEDDNTRRIKMKRSDFLKSSIGFAAVGSISVAKENEEVFGMENRFIRSYFNGRQVGYELLTRVTDSHVVIEVAAHGSDSANPDRSAWVIHKQPAPAKVEWRLCDETKKTTLIQDTLRFESKIIVGESIYRYKYRRVGGGSNP